MFSPQATYGMSIAERARWGMRRAIREFFVAWLLSVGLLFSFMHPIDGALFFAFLLGFPLALALWMIYRIVRFGIGH